MDNNKLALYEAKKANSTKIWLLFLFLGWSYGSLGQVGLQILYYLTLGLGGFWVLFRLFTLNGAIKKYNRDIASRIGLSSEEMRALNLL